MLLTEVTTDDGQKRVYFSRQNSVVSFFDEDDGGNVRANAMPSEFACPWSTTAGKVDAVKSAMLDETARRLHCRPDQVGLMSMADIVAVADPPLKEKHGWTGRVKKRDGRR